METKPTRILAISGSLRNSSYNNKILQIISSLAPANIDFIIYDRLGDIPPFNDVESAAVNEFRRSLKDADGIFICTPEYAFGVPGVLKNALDWTVSSAEFDQKPVALVTASSVGDKAHASLLLTLTALSANVAEGSTLLIPFIRSKFNDEDEIDGGTLKEILSVLDSLLQTINVSRR